MHDAPCSCTWGSLYPSGKLSTGSRAGGHGQKAGEACGHRTNGHLFSRGCWAATIINGEEGRKAAPRAGLCDWSMGEMPAWHLWVNLLHA